MTRAFVRVLRDGHWGPVEIDQLTDEELEVIAKEQGVERGWVWAKYLAKWIRDNIREAEQP